MKQTIVFGILIVLAAQAFSLPEVRYRKFASGLTAPTCMIAYRDWNKAFLVAEQNGKISLLRRDGGRLGEVFLDLSDKIVSFREKFDERGLLGMALHPRFEHNRRFFVFYSAPLRKGAPGKYSSTSTVSEFRIAKDFAKVIPYSERVILEIDQPQWNHNSGSLAFGPDGYLYIGVGDGGSGNDKGMGHIEPGGNSQSLDSLLGKILRIDVDKTEDQPYLIPENNPFVGKEGRDEIYAYGLRNPWGLTFEDTDGDIWLELFCADVGQHRFEEVNIIRPGGNYGWRKYEGFHDHDINNPSQSSDINQRPNMPEDYQAPIFAYPHSVAFGESPVYGVSVTGGLFYHGEKIPQLRGTYVFADWQSSWGPSDYGLFGGVRDVAGNWSIEAIPEKRYADRIKGLIYGFAHDKSNELYILVNESNYPVKGRGMIYKILPVE